MFGEIVDIGLFASSSVCNLVNRGRFESERMALSERSRASTES